MGSTHRTYRVVSSRDVASQVEFGLLLLCANINPSDKCPSRIDIVHSGGPVVSVNVPPELPEILKRYTKAAIKTQPTDVLAWSAA